MSNLIEAIHNRSRSSDLILWLILVFGAVYLVFLFPSPEYPILNKDDGSWFMTLGINIAEYGRYSMDTMRRADYVLHATWPPLFPLFLAMIISLFGVSWFAIKVGMVATGLATLAVLWRLWSSTTLGRLAVLLTAVSPYFFLYSHHTMAEIPYMLAVALTLLLLDRSTSRGELFVAGAVAAVAFLTRGYAIVLLPTGVLFILLKSNRSIVDRLTCCMVFSVPMLVMAFAWTGYTNHVIASGNIDGFTARYGNGTGVLAGLLRSPVEHLQRFYWHDGRHPVFLMLPVIDASTVRTQFWPFVVSVFLLSLATLGWLRSLRGNLSSVAIWVPAKIAILWAIQPAFRYWLPLLPYFFFYTLVGTQYLSDTARSLRLLFPVLVGVLLTSGILGLISHLVVPNHLRFYDQYGIESRDIMMWARDHLPSNAVVITESPADVFSAARRRAFSLQAAADAWLPEELDRETDIYLLCPKIPEARTHYPRSYEICRRLQQEGHFIPINEFPLIGLYRFRPK